MVQGLNLDSAKLDEPKLSVGSDKNVEHRISRLDSQTHLYHPLFRRLGVRSSGLFFCVVEG